MEGQQGSGGPRGVSQLGPGVNAVRWRESEDPAPGAGVNTLVTQSQTDSRVASRACSAVTSSASTPRTGAVNALNPGNTFGLGLAGLLQGHGNEGTPPLSRTPSLPPGIEFPAPNLTFEHETFKMNKFEVKVMGQTYQGLTVANLLAMSRTPEYQDKDVFVGTMLHSDRNKGSFLLLPNLLSQAAAYNLYQNALRDLASESIDLDEALERLKTAPATTRARWDSLFASRALSATGVSPPHSPSSLLPDPRAGSGLYVPPPVSAARAAMSRPPSTELPPGLGQAASGSHSPSPAGASSPRPPSTLQPDLATAAAAALALSSTRAPSASHSPFTAPPPGLAGARAGGLFGAALAPCNTGEATVTWPPAVDSGGSSSVPSRPVLAGLGDRVNIGGVVTEAVSGLDASALLPSSIDAHGRRAAAAAAAAASRALTAQRPPAPRLPSAAPPPRLAGEEIGLFDTAQLTHTTDAPSVNWPPAAGNVDGIAASGMAVPPGPEDAGRRVTIGAAVNKRASQDGPGMEAPHVAADGNGSSGNGSNDDDNDKDAAAAEGGAEGEAEDTRAPERELRTLSEGEFTVNMLRSGWPQQFVTGIKTSWVGLVGATGDWGGLYSAMSAEPTGEALAGLLNRALSEACRPGIPAFVQSYERLCKEYPRVQSEGGWQQVPSTSRRPVSPSPSQAAPTQTPQAVTGTQSEEWERNNAYAGLARMSAD